MTQSKHTPGPWMAGTDETTDEGGMPVRAIDPSDGLRFGVADVYGINIDVHHCDVSKANARLIAAAPELLEALQEGAQIDNLHRQMHRIEQRRNKGSFGIAVADDEYAIEWQELSNEVEILISKRNAAIDKATGA